MLLPFFSCRVGVSALLSEGHSSQAVFVDVADDVSESVHIVLSKECGSPYTPAYFFLNVTKTGFRETGGDSLALTTFVLITISGGGRGTGSFSGSQRILLRVMGYPLS